MGYEYGSGFIWLRIENNMTDTYENCNEFSGSIKSWETVGLSIRILAFSCLIRYR
jgi:hypothetical protein